jgi:hypothetical protein
MGDFCRRMGKVHPAACPPDDVFCSFCGENLPAIDREQGGASDQTQQAKQAVPGPPLIDLTGTPDKQNTSAMYVSGSQASQAVVGALYAAAQRQTVEAARQESIAKTAPQPRSMIKGPSLIVIAWKLTVRIGDDSDDEEEGEGDDILRIEKTNNLRTYSP